MSIKAYGTTLGHADSIDGSYTTLARVEKITPPMQTVNDIETTALDSADEHEEFLAGMKGTAELKATIQYDQTAADSLVSLLGVGHFYKVAFVDGSGYKGPAYLKSVGVAEVAKDGILRNEVTIRPTGKWTHYTD